MPAVCPGWTALGASVRGASHLGRHLPNQDSLSWSPETGSGPPLVLAVADGHGDPRSFLSHFGSEFATTAVCRLALERLTPLSHMIAAGNPELGVFTSELVARWTASVLEHSLQAGPLLEAGLQGLLSVGDSNARSYLSENPLFAYGTTLLFALLTENGILYGQLGDGDILEISQNGELTRPIPSDPRLVGNATTSLCLPDAAGHFRFCIRPPARPLPVALMLATDGYSNSFKDQSGFLQVASDLLEAVRTEGVAAVRRDLPHWLSETSSEGSGDDISAGLLFSPEALRPASGEKPARRRKVG